MKQVTTTLKRWLKAHDLDNIKVREDADFFADTTEEIVWYSLNKPDEVDEMFYTVAKKEGLKVDCGIFILSLFHEIGHVMTYDIFDDDYDDRMQAEKDALTGDYKAINERYFYIDDEITATRWGIDFINEHSKAIMELKEKLQALEKGLDNLKKM